MTEQTQPEQSNTVKFEVRARRSGETHKAHVFLCSHGPLTFNVSQLPPDGSVEIRREDRHVATMTLEEAALIGHWLLELYDQWSSS
jgi:hypothetical protein